MDPSEVKIPYLKDLTSDNITENVKSINGQCPDPRLKYIVERLVQHLHDFARETRLSMDEWMTGINFLTKVGQTCTDVRQVSPLRDDQSLCNTSVSQLHLRNSSFFPTSSAYPSLSIVSITRNHRQAQKAQYSDHSIHMKPKANQTAP